MSRITDAIDGAGEAPLELPTRPSGVVADEPSRRDAALAELERGGSLADALEAACVDVPELEVLGFAATDAEPFAVAAGATADVVAAVRARFADPRGGAAVGVVEPMWASHRGHAVWLHPASGAPLVLALRLAEELDPSRALAGLRGSLTRVADAAAAGEVELAALLEGERFEALVASVEPDVSYPEPTHDDVRAGWVLFGADGSALVARTPASTPFGLVERAGRPWLLPLHGTSVLGWLSRLHRAVDLDTAPSSWLAAGAVLDGDAPPVLLGDGGALAQSTSSQR